MNFSNEHEQSSHLHLSPTRLIIGIILAVLILGNVLFYFKYWLAQRRVNQLESTEIVRHTNEKSLIFLKLFVSEVLKAKGEIDFETRLCLENAVRNIGDEEILTQWQKFTDSQNENEAQQNVKDLLELSINKVQAY